MKQVIYVLASAIILFASACSNEVRQDNETAVTTMPKEDSAEKIKRGEYLVTIMGCNDCHTPKKFTDKGPVPDMDRMLSGYNASESFGAYDTAMTKGGKWVLFNTQSTGFAGPWGLSFAANLTPDETGIGNWSIDNFKKAFKEGKSKGIDAARPLLPPMPWPNYTHIKDEDIEAIFAYLKSIKPVNNRVPNCVVFK